MSTPWRASGSGIARVREVSHLMFFDDPEQCVSIVAEFAAR
jgi:pimeloyl-ACP methyl ester carboxylesterase